MKISYDNLADAMYIRYSNNKVSNSKIVNDSVIDFDLDGNVVGIEIIGVEKLFKDNNIIIHKGKQIAEELVELNK